MSLTPPGPPPSELPGPGPSGPSAQPTGWVVLTLQGNMMTSNVIAPVVRINGYVMPTTYGQNVYPLAPGMWHIDVHAKWLRTYGEAAIDVQVLPGRTVPVFYAAPLHQFTTGSIGHVKQRRKGAAAFIAILSALAVFFALMLAVVVA